MTIQGLRDLGFTVYNKSGFPIVYAVIGNNEDLVHTANMLFEDGILVTVSPFPMVKKGDEGQRITLTAANTEDEVQHLLKAFARVQDYMTMKTAVCKKLF